MKQKTFIVPHDFTNVGDVALAHAIATAKLSDTVIQLLHVVSKEGDIKEAINKLDLVISNFSNQGVTLIPNVRIGNIFDDISDFAAEHQAELIFMGTHGMKGLQRLIGSNALRVITKSKVPFVITQDRIPNDNEINDIVVPIDMAKEDKQILTSVIRSSHVFKAKVHLFVNKQKDEFNENAVARNLAFSKKYLAEHEVNFTVSHTNGMDTFENELIRFSQNIGADMIAIVNHHEGGLTNLLGNNFDQNVITNDAKIPVLIANSVDNTTVDNIFGVFR